MSSRHFDELEAIFASVLDEERAEPPGDATTPEGSCPDLASGRGQPTASDQES